MQLSLHRRPHYSNLFSSETTGPIIAKFHMELPMGWGNESLFATSVSHDNMAITSIYGKNTLKLFFSGTEWPVALGV